ncbi:MAG: ATP-binding protein [Paludibacteraceae bacterium]|nr:ATP-binding protein [Paludibacteraceae bacterium]
MQRLLENYNRLLGEKLPSSFRYLYDAINWDNRLIVLKGARGVGKTTMLLQHISRSFEDPAKALYVSADHIWFANHSLIALAEYHYIHGGTHLFIDEVHKYPNWQQEIKNIYDSYPRLNVVVTGSSMLRLEHALGDLSRRCKLYTMRGLSFREYLKLENIADWQVLPLEEIIQHHTQIAGRLTGQVKVLGYFEQYLRHGYYPFYQEEGNGFGERLQRVINTVISEDIPAIVKVEYETIYKLKQLLAILSEQSPYTLNVSALARVLETSTSQVMKLIDLLSEAAIIRRLFSKERSMKMLQKPEKVLFDNSNIMYALSQEVDQGTLRETFFADMLSHSHSISMPQKGDLLVDKQLLFEVGGRTKGYKQIANIPDSYVVADGIDIGFENKIPLWMFGLLY